MSSAGDGDAENPGSTGAAQNPPGDGGAENPAGDAARPPADGLRDTRVIQLGAPPAAETLGDLHGGRERLTAVRDHFRARVEAVQRIAAEFDGVEIVDASESGALIVTADAAVWPELAGPDALLGIDGLQIEANVPIGLERPAGRDDPAGILSDEPPGRRA